ncbi:glycosyltransferase [Sneathiella sp.]|uniref:glycosyltransferase n=1 Tax=Sneathiella sp. TaxID=1964365 RepID=UPI002FE41A08
MEEFELSIVIPHYNDPVGLAACLATLETQTYDKSRFEVIVCDNDSDQSIEALNGYDINIRLIQETRRGAGPARNAGVEVARGRFLAFTDCDCLLEPDFVENGLRHLRRAGERSVMAGEIILYPEAESPNAVEAFDMVYSTNQRNNALKKEAATGNLWTSLSFFREVGPFYADVAEDTDWCKRALNKGATFLFGHDCIVRHPARKSLDELKAKWKRQSAMTFNMWKKRSNFKIKWPILCLITAFSFVPHALKALTDKKLNHLSERLKAILVLTWCRLFRAKIMVDFYISGVEHIDPNKYWRR